MVEVRVRQGWRELADIIPEATTTAATDNTAALASLAALIAADGVLAPKVLAYVTYSGATPTLQYSVNVFSISAVATGRLAITFTIPFTTANYVAIPVGTATGAAAGGGKIINIGSGTQLAGSVEVQSRELNTAITTYALTDPDAIAFAAWGTQ